MKIEIPDEYIAKLIKRSAKYKPTLTQYITVHFSDSDFSKILRAAQKRDMPLATLCREIIIKNI